MTFWEKVKNFFSTMEKASHSERLFTQEEKAQARLKVCRSCPFFSDYSVGEICDDCGCFIKAKINLDAATCPQGKWES